MYPKEFGSYFTIIVKYFVAMKCVNIVKSSEMYACEGLKSDVNYCSFCT